MKKVLLIEDDTLARHSMRAVLDGAGYEVTEAEGGKEGLAAIAETLPDLVVTDILMPDMDGLEVLQSIKRNADTSPKVLAISSGGNLSGEAYVELARDLGADGTLPKPFGSEEFLQAVAGLLGQ